MPKTVKVNFAVQPETASGIEKLAAETHRGKADVIDWLVADALDRIEIARRESVSLEQVTQKVEV